MTKGYNKLTKKEKKELQSLIDDIIFEAKEVKLDYDKNPSENSGSVIQVHEGSPYLVTREERLIDLNLKKNKKDVDSNN